MAYDLLARLRVQDQMTATLRRVERQLSQLNSASHTTDRALNKMSASQRILRTTTMGTADAFRGMGNASTKALASIRSGSSGIVGQVSAITAAYLSARGAAELFDKTIGGASRMELNQITLEALMSDQKKAAGLFDMLQKKAAISTLSETDFMQMGKAFLPLTKQLNDIDKLTNITERLALSNPLQGAEGAAFSIREALSGDLVSLQERFNLPRSMLKEAFKGADTLTKKTAALERVLNKMGYTQAFVTKVNKSASAQWDQLTSNLEIAMAKMGTDALDKLKPVLVDINKWLAGPGFKAFTDRGAKLLADGFDAALTSAKDAWNYLDSHYFSNPAFGKLPDITSKISFIIDDLTKTFNAWLDGGGQDMLNNIGTTSVDVLAKAIENGAPRLADAGLVVGRALGEAILNSAVHAFDQLFTDPTQYGVAFEQKRADNAQKTFGFLGLPQPSPDEIIAETDRKKKNMAWLDNAMKSIGIGSGVENEAPASKFHGPPSPKPKTSSTGKPATTAAAPTVNISMNGLTIREEADINRLALRIAREMNAITGN